MSPYMDFNEFLRQFYGEGQANRTATGAGMAAQRGTPTETPKREPKPCEFCGIATANEYYCNVCEAMVLSLDKSSYWGGIQKDWIREQDHKRKLIEGGLD